MEAHQRVTRRWDQGAESREKLSRAHHAMRLTTGWGRESMGDAAVREHERPNVFILGPERIISKKVADQLDKDRKLARSVERIDADTPVENAIAFARYEKGDFGWGVVVPGYNFAVANLSRPLDAAAAARRRPRGVGRPAGPDRPGHGADSRAAHVAVRAAI